MFNFLFYFKYPIFNQYNHVHNIDIHSFSLPIWSPDISVYLLSYNPNLNVSQIVHIFNESPINNNLMESCSMI